MIAKKSLEKRIGIIGGGGTGPEIIESALSCLYMIEEKINTKFNVKMFENKKWYEKMGVENFDKKLYSALHDFFYEIKNSNGIILRGAINAPTLYKLREDFDLMYKITPLWGIPELADLTRFSKEELKGLDILLSREAIHGLFHSGEQAHSKNNKAYANITITYNRKSLEDYANFLFNLSEKRRKQNFADKAYVHLAMPTRKTGLIGVLWEEVFDNASKNYPNAVYQRMYPNINNPCRWVQTRKDFDGVYGPFDIIGGPDDFMDSFMDDMVWAIHGELTLAPSVHFSRSGNGYAHYQTLHGTLKPLAGKDQANPIGIIHALAIALEWSYGMKKEAGLIKKAVRKTLADGYRTIDIYRGKPNTKLVGTKEMTEKIIENLYELYE